MTAATKAPAWLPAMEKWRSYGGWLSTARVAADGRVIVHTIHMVARTGVRSTVELWPTQTSHKVLGRIDPDDLDAWAKADALIREAGYVTCEQWTTINRLPAVRVRRASDHPAGPCGSVIYVGAQLPMSCRLAEGHDGNHANRGVSWSDDL